MPRLVEELRIAHGDGSYIKFLKSLAKSARFPGALDLRSCMHLRYLQSLKAGMGNDYGYPDGA